MAPGGTRASILPDWSALPPARERHVSERAKRHPCGPDAIDSGNPVRELEPVLPWAKGFTANGALALAASPLRPAPINHLPSQEMVVCSIGRLPTSLP